MDILSHGLWAAAAAKTAQRTIRVSIPRTAFWGIFPDLAGLTPLFLSHVAVAFSATGNFWHSFWYGKEPSTALSAAVLDITPTLYAATHSIPFFAAIFGLLYFLRKYVLKPKFPSIAVPAIPWELGGWLLHILLDIPTHSYAFYPTPFLWPFSDLLVNGISWTTPWFLAANYGMLAVIGLLFLLRRARKTW